MIRLVLCALHKVCGSLEHDTDEGDDVEPGEGGGVALVVLDQPSTSGIQAKDRSTTQRFGIRTKPFLASASLITQSSIP